MPTPQVTVEAMLDLAKVTPQDFLMDLGSGDGRTVITAGKRGLGAEGRERLSEVTVERTVYRQRFRAQRVRQGQ